MRRLVFTDQAADRFEAQIDDLIDRHANAAARSLRTRVSDYIRYSLLPFPATGKYIQGRDIWEVWSPGTRLVVWYQFDDDIVTLITFWHTSQDRWP